MWIHVKYTCQPPENSLDELGIPKNPYFDPSHDFVASFSRIIGGGIECLPPSELLEFVCIPSNKGLMELQALGRAHLEPNKEKVALTDGSFNILLRPVRIILF